MPTLKKERACFFAAHFEQSLAFVEGHVREGTKRNLYGWIFCSLRRSDHHIGQPDQFLLDHPNLL
jgi:hypothetical protein